MVFLLQTKNGGGGEEILTTFLSFYGRIILFIFATLEQDFVEMTSLHYDQLKHTQKKMIWFNQEKKKRTIDMKNVFVDRKKKKT